MSISVPSEVALKGEDFIKKYIELQEKQYNATAEFDRLGKLYTQKLESLYKLMTTRHFTTIDKQSGYVSQFHKSARIHDNAYMDYQTPVAMHELSKEIMNLSGAMIDCQRDFWQLRDDMDSLKA